MKMRKNITIGLLVLTLAVLAGCSNQNTHETTNTISILFVGNSHVRTGNVPAQLQALARLNGIEMIYVDVSGNGVNLDGTMRDNAIREMQSRNFDYVVMQARGRSLINDIDLFLDDIRLFSEQIREHGATPVLYSPAWANINGQPNEELQEFLTGAHKQAAYENDLVLINAGDAWVYAYRNISGLSLCARDGIHANHTGAFLTANVFATTLFDLHIENIPIGNLIDNLPMLNIITIVGFMITILVVIYRLVKKQPLQIKKSIVVIISLALLQTMNFFPHIFRFTESGNRLLLLYVVTLILLVVMLCSIYSFVRIKFLEKQSLSASKKYVFYALVCIVIYGLTFIPALELRSHLYRADDAYVLAQAAWDFVNQIILAIL